MLQCWQCTRWRWTGRPGSSYRGLCRTTRNQVTPRKKMLSSLTFAKTYVKSENQLFLKSKISIFAHFSLQQSYFLSKKFSSMILLNNFQTRHLTHCKFIFLVLFSFWKILRLHRRVAVILGSFNKTTKNDALRLSIIWVKIMNRRICLLYQDVFRSICYSIFCSDPYP